MNETTITSKKRIDWLDGIKGISCLFIFFHHFCLQYFPAAYFGNSQPSRLNGFDTFLSTSPLGIIVNGNFFVHLFIFISGYVITYQILSMKPEKIGFFLFKRYLKLLFPLAIYSLIIFITRFFSFFGEENFIKTVIKEIYKTADSLLFGILFKGDIYLGGHLWMMHCIFLGGILVALITSLYWITNNKKIIFIPVSFGILLLCFYSPLPRKIHFATVFFGSALCMLNSFYSLKIRKWILWILAFLSLLLGAFPSGLAPTNFYRFLLIPFDSANTASYYMWHCISVIILLFCFTFLDTIQKIFENKLFLFLAKISLWVFLLHGIILSLTNPLFNYLQKSILGYSISALCIFVIDMIILIISSWSFTQFITPLGNKLINSLISNLLPAKE